MIAFCLGILLPGRVSAQFTMAKPTEIALVKERQLIVLLDAPTKKEIEKFAKKDKNGSAAELEKAYVDYNSALDTVMQRSWTIHDTFQTMQLDAFKALGKEEKKKYVVVFCSSYEEALYNKTFIPQDHLLIDPTLSRFAKNFTHPVFSICLGEKLENKLTNINPQLFSIDLPEDQPVGSALAFAVRLANYYFKIGAQYTAKSKSPFELMAKQNDYKLKTKTLLLRKDWLHPDLTEKTAKYLYRYPLQVVDAFTYDSLVLSGDPKYVYFAIVPKPQMNMNAQNYIHYYYVLADNADGALCAWYLPNIITAKYKAQFDKILLDDKTLKKIGDTFY